MWVNPLSPQIDESPGRPHRALGACDGQIQPCRLADCSACLLWEVAGHTLPGHPEKPGALSTWAHPGTRQLASKPPTFKHDGQS